MGNLIRIEYTSSSQIFKSRLRNRIKSISLFKTIPNILFLEKIYNIDYLYYQRKRFIFDYLGGE